MSDELARALDTLCAIADLERKRGVDEALTAGQFISLSIEDYGHQWVLKRVLTSRAFPGHAPRLQVMSSLVESWLSWDGVRLSGDQEIAAAKALGWEGRL